MRVLLMERVVKSLPPVVALVLAAATCEGQQEMERELEMLDEQPVQFAGEGG